MSYDTLKNNINKSISRLEEDDIDLDHIGVGTDHDVTVGYSDVSEEKCDVTGDKDDADEKCDVTVSDNEHDVPKHNPMDLFARNRPDPVFTGDDDY